MDISIPYYEDKTRISNSNIGWFLNKGPSFLHKMLTEDAEEDKSAALIRGTMIHEYLLQPEEFQKDYVVWDKQKPVSAQEIKFCDALANSVEIEPNKATIEAYKSAYSTTGKSEDKILSEALKKVSMLKDYIEFKKTGDNRIMIEPWQAIQLAKIKNNIIEHKAANNLLKHTDEKSIFHEFHINWEFSYKHNENIVFTCACKSLLDSVTFIHAEKKIVLMDLKTTSHLHHFEDAVNTYDYTRQLYYYTLALKWYLENEMHENSEEWTFEWYIIAIDSFTSNIRVFAFTKEQIYSNVKKVNDALYDIVWHMTNNLWNHSRTYYEGSGIEFLNL